MVIQENFHNLTVEEYYLLIKNNLFQKIKGKIVFKIAKKDQCLLENHLLTLEINH